MGEGAVIRREQSRQDSVPSQELAGVFAPIVQGFLGVLGLYYCVVTIAHGFEEQGWNLAVLAGLSAITAVMVLGFAWLVRRGERRLTRIEVMVLAANIAILANVVVYLLIHYQEHKLSYFVVMSLAFATASPTRRTAYPSVAVALACMWLMATQSSPEVRNQYTFIGLAAGFAAIGMSSLMRGAVMRELKARLAAEALNRQIELELGRNTELRRHAQELAEREQAANRTKSEFLAMITHELRTPLNGVLGMAQAMSLDEMSAGQRARLETIQASGQVLLATVNDVLDISKIETGQLELEPGAFDLETWAEDLAELYRGLALEKGLAFNFEIAPSARGWRIGDATRLRQVLNNLLSNALKFTEHGAITTRIDCDGDLLSVSVLDTGIGFAAVDSAALFEMFVQADASSTRRFGGTGLGLAICREILSLMGGQISATGAPGRGACFAFSVPLRVTSAPADAQSRVEPVGMDRARVLVADDNPTNRLVAQTLLAQFGLDVSAVASGAEALEAWETANWDAIFMDIHMPVMDGLTAATTIRARERAKGRARTPIIALTASVQAYEIEAYFSAGMDDYLAKPIEMERLLAVLQAALDPQVESVELKAAIAS